MQTYKKMYSTCIANDFATIFLFLIPQIALDPEHKACLYKIMVECSNLYSIIPNHSML